MNSVLSSWSLSPGLSAIETRFSPPSLQLAVGVEKLEQGARSSSLRNANQRRALADQVRRYGASAEVIGSILSAIPAVGTFGKVLKGLGSASKTLKGPPLSTLKQELDEALAGLNHRIVVLIDDVDRLEPREAIELLRLVRSVADFRNVVYLQYLRSPGAPRSDAQDSNSRRR